MPKTTRLAVPSSSSPTSSLSPDSIFRCRAVNFGAYLLVATKLAYRGAGLCANNSDVDLLFYDPEHAGPEMQRRFNDNLIVSADAKALVEARGRLLAEIAAAKSSGAGRIMPADKPAGKDVKKEGPLWSRARAAKELDIDTQTVDKYIRVGWLIAYQLGGGRTIRIERQSVLAILNRVHPCR